MFAHNVPIELWVRHHSSTLHMSYICWAVCVYSMHMRCVSGNSHRDSLGFIFLLLRLQSQFNEELLQLLITIVDTKLLKTKQTDKERQSELSLKISMTILFNNKWRKLPRFKDDQIIKRKALFFYIMYEILFKVLNIKIWLIIWYDNYWLILILYKLTFKYTHVNYLYSYWIFMLNIYYLKYNNKIYNLKAPVSLWQRTSGLENGWIYYI